MILLDKRSVIAISGPDRKFFLQGLITNDINKINKDQAVYSLMLNPQGRFLYDFFIFEDNEYLLLDCSKDRQDEIINKLLFYKLRAKVRIEKKEDLLVFSSILNQSIDTPFYLISSDPRSSKMGFRILKKKELVQDSIEKIIEKNFYDYNRISLKIPDDSDLFYDKSLPVEYGFDNFNAIDYQKGCYIGQEVTARTHYKGMIRKKIFLVEAKICQQLEKGTEINDGNKNIGVILSSVFYQKKLLALALIRNIDNQENHLEIAKLNLKTEQNVDIILID